MLSVLLKHKSELPKKCPSLLKEGERKSFRGNRPLERTCKIALVEESALRRQITRVRSLLLLHFRIFQKKFARLKVKKDKTKVEFTETYFLKIYRHNY